MKVEPTINGATLIVSDSKISIRNPELFDLFMYFWIFLVYSYINIYYICSNTLPKRNCIFQKPNETDLHSFLLNDWQIEQFTRRDSDRSGCFGDCEAVWTDQNCHQQRERERERCWEHNMFRLRLFTSAELMVWQETNLSFFNGTLQSWYSAEQGQLSRWTTP